jgi:hypothetical protein
MSAPFHDVGEKEGQAFIAMELLEGATLKHGISGRSLKIETLLATTDIGSENATQPAISRN